MASILDAGLANIFSGIFVFLLVYAIMWGGLTKLKLFGDNPGSYAIIAFTVAFLSAIASPARNFVLFIAPWSLALAIVIFFILFIVGLFGLKADKDFPDMIRQARLYVWIIIFCILIFVFGLAYSFGQQALEAQGPAYQAPPGTQQVIGADGQVMTEAGPVENPGTPYQNPTIITPGPINPYSTPQPGQPGATATNNFTTNMVNTLIHPKVLGLIIVFVIAAVAIYFLSSN